jgi:hypothetical protein
MDDQQIHQTIARLVAEEHALRAAAEHTDEQRARIRVLDQSLDQCWDLLRQREARREFHEDPDVATPRPVPEVEGYLQ